MPASCLESLFDDLVGRRAPGAQIDLHAFPTHGGVYALVDAGGRLVQLAGGHNLRRCVAARLEAPASGTRRTSLSEVVDAVWWAAAFSQFETTLRYHAIARVLHPGDYRRRCAFGPAYFAIITLPEPLPRWRVSDDIRKDADACVGPFMRRGACESFIRHIEDVYSLCRYHHILDKTPNGEACAYHDMGRCVAPCDGTVGIETYVQEVRRSVLGILDGCRGDVAQLHEDMTAAACDLQFERAARLKEDLATAETLARILRMAGRRPADFRYLIVQRGGGRTWVKAFFVNGGEIDVSKAVRIRDLAEATRRWCERMAAMDPGTPADTLLARERVWLISHYLDRAERMPGLFLRHDRVGAREALATCVAEAFASKRG